MIIAATVEAAIIKITGATIFPSLQPSVWQVPQKSFASLVFSHVLAGPQFLTTAVFPVVAK